MRTSGKIGLATAAAFGLAYGGYLVGANSNDSTQSKPLEETVCEEVDTGVFWEAGRKAGYMEGLKAGRREGEVIGEREGRDKGFESGRAYGYELGTNNCNERYNEGLIACDDTKYQDGMVEGERLGLMEGQLKFYGTGTAFKSENGAHYFFAQRYNDKGELVMSKVKIDEHKCISRTFTINSGIKAVFLEDLCINGRDADGLVDNIELWDIDAETEVYERARDFYAHQDVFSSADETMREHTEIFSHYSDSEL